VAASIGALTWLLQRGADVADLPATTTIPVPTTLPPGDTAAAEALVDEFYAAYNAGDAEGAVGLLSTVFREVSPGNLRYWAGTLGEQIDAECSPSPSQRDGLLCVETYTDDLHGPAGLSARSQYLYFERNGRLQQTPNPASPLQSLLTGCRENRCPGEDLRQTQAGEVTWSYDRFEADLFAWLERTHPGVAAEIGDASSLGYFSSNRAAAEAALPYVEEFVEQSSEWGDVRDPDLSGLTPLQAVEAAYAALNSGDPEVYAAFFGRPPDTGMVWLWELGTRWIVDCDPAAGPDRVRCDVETIDEFYTKAGAVFRSTSLFVLDEGRLVDIPEQETSSFVWAYQIFEPDFMAWLRTAHPEEHEIAAEGSFMARAQEAATIARTYVDEFLNQSDEYPRDPGVTDY
jgi:hypothetical protein